MTKAPNGITYIKNGRYYVRIYYYVDGKRKSKDYATGVHADNSSPRKAKQQERAAHAKLDEILLQNRLRQKSGRIGNQEQQFTATVAQWYTHQCGSKAPGTLSSYKYAVNDITYYFNTYLPVKTVDITPAHIEQYLNWERARRQPNYTGKDKKRVKYADGSGIENTVMHRATVIRSVLQYAKREGIVDRNAASKNDSQIDLPKPQRHEFCVLNVEEAQRLLQQLNHEDLWFRIAVTMGLLLGLRRSEIIGLRVSDINFADNSICVSHTVTQQTLNGKNTLTPRPFTKNRTPKSFTISPAFAGLLQTLAEEHKRNAMLFGSGYEKTWEGYLMRYPDGKLVSPNALTEAFSRFVKKNNFKPLRFHDLRHSCASILYANGTDLMTIQEILGHAQLTTTISYTHKISDRKGKALADMSERFFPENHAEKEEPEN